MARQQPGLRPATLSRPSGSDHGVLMQFLQTFQLYDFFDTLVSLFMAFVFGALIGAERQYRQRSAGLRTNVLVSVGAAAFVDLADHLGGAEGSVRVIAYVVSGIGFLGAGAIMKEGTNVRGLNTAATLWASAAVGSCAGTDMVAQSAALTLFVLAGNTLLRPLVNAIDRIPLNEHSSEASYEVIFTTDAKRAADIRDFLNERLETVNYPIRETKVVYRSNDNVEIAAKLVSRNRINSFQPRSARGMRRDGGSVFPAHVNTGDPDGPLRPVR
jgi:putative Mg2+ transporter-C (MgtC) family protein